MKKLFLFAATILLYVNCFGKIWRVNNNSGITADFTTLQAAHNGANAGDTIYLESSPTSYGSLTASKKIIIIGTGYFLDQNTGLQAFTLTSKVGSITLNGVSSGNPSGGSSGSIIEGLTFEGNTVYVNANDIVIRKNYFGSFNGNSPDWTTGAINIGYNWSVSNTIISQNFACYINNNQPSTGILIMNNFIEYGLAYGEGTTNQCLVLHVNTIAIVKNNIFRRGAVLAYNSNFTNNIMYTGYFSGSGNLISNNLAGVTQFGTSDGNQSNVSMASVFELAGSYDAFYKLKAGSPALGAGYGSTAQNPVDAGMYGGSTPYVLSGIPAIPSIYFFANQPVGSNSDPIDVQIKVRSNK